MAKFSLTKRELASGELPLLCMKCSKTILKPANKLLEFRPGVVLLSFVVCGLVSAGILATGMTGHSGFRSAFSVFAAIAFFALRRPIVKIPTRLPVCDKHRDQRKIPLLTMLGIVATGAIPTYISISLSDTMPAAIVTILFYVGIAVMVIGYIVGSIMLRVEIKIASVDGENVMLTNISDAFIEALTEQRKNAPVPVVEDIGVDQLYRVAELPQDQSSWRNIDMSD